MLHLIQDEDFGAGDLEQLARHPCQLFRARAVITRRLKTLQHRDRQRPAGRVNGRHHPQYWDVPNPVDHRWRVIRQYRLDQFGLANARWAEDRQDQRFTAQTALDRGLQSIQTLLERRMLNQFVFHQRRHWASPCPGFWRRGAADSVPTDDGVSCAGSVGCRVAS